MHMAAEGGDDSGMCDWVSHPRTPEPHRYTVRLLTPTTSREGFDHAHADSCDEEEGDGQSHLYPRQHRCQSLPCPSACSARSAAQARFSTAQECRMTTWSSGTGTSSSAFGSTGPLQGRPLYLDFSPCAGSAAARAGVAPGEGRTEREDASSSALLSSPALCLGRPTVLHARTTTGILSDGSTSAQPQHTNGAATCEGSLQHTVPGVFLGSDSSPSWVGKKEAQHGGCQGASNSEDLSNVGRGCTHEADLLVSPVTHTSRSDCLVAAWQQRHQEGHMDVGHGEEEGGASECKMAANRKDESGYPAVTAMSQCSTQNSYTNHPFTSSDAAYIRYPTDDSTAEEPEMDSGDADPALCADTQEYAPCLSQQQPQYTEGGALSQQSGGGLYLTQPEKDISLAGDNCTALAAVVSVSPFTDLDHAPRKAYHRSSSLPAGSGSSGKRRSASPSSNLYCITVGKGGNSSVACEQGSYSGGRCSCSAGRYEQCRRNQEGEEEEEEMLIGNLSTAGISPILASDYAAATSDYPQTVSQPTVGHPFFLSGLPGESTGSSSSTLRRLTHRQMKMWEQAKSTRNITNNTLDRSGREKVGMVGGTVAPGGGVGVGGLECVSRGMPGDCPDVPSLACAENAVYLASLYSHTNNPQKNSYSSSNNNESASHFTPTRADDQSTEVEYQMLQLAVNSSPTRKRLFCEEAGDDQNSRSIGAPQAPAPPLHSALFGESMLTFGGCSSPLFSDITNGCEGPGGGGRSSSSCTGSPKYMSTTVIGGGSSLTGFRGGGVSATTRTGKCSSGLQLLRSRKRCLEDMLRGISPTQRKSMLPGSSATRNSGLIEPGECQDPGTTTEVMAAAVGIQQDASDSFKKFRHELAVSEGDRRDPCGYV